LALLSPCKARCDSFILLDEIMPISEPAKNACMDKANNINKIELKNEISKTKPFNPLYAPGA